MVRRFKKRGRQRKKDELRQNGIRWNDENVEDTILPEATIVNAKGDVGMIFVNPGGEQGIEKYTSYDRCKLFDAN
jgi:hypothetical protein